MAPTSRLRELIRQVRACKTAAEEREVVARESAAIREASREEDSPYRHRNVAKLMYIHMLGYPTHFGQMETLKLIAGANSLFPEKRIGYLGLTILLDERQEVLMLITNSLRYDLNAKNQFIVGLALTAMGNICSASMARDLSPEVERHLDNPNPYIRKKAALCAMRVVSKVPELVEGYIDKGAELLHDKNQAVMLAGVSLMAQMCELDAGVAGRYRSLIPLLIKALKQLLHGGGMSAEHDVGGVTNPHLQVKILRLLRILGKGSPEASDQMSDMLAQVAANIEGGGSARNAGNAVLYECVQTIMGVESAGGLRVLAINILGRFLASRDNNMRYVALAILQRVVDIDLQAVQRHRATVLECVKDPDTSIRRRALDLSYALATEANVKDLVADLLEYIANGCDADFKPDLTGKLCTMVQRFAADQRWCIDCMTRLLVTAGAHVQEESCRALLVLITNAPGLQAYATRALYRALRAGMAAEPSGSAPVPTWLAATACWLLGEYGELLVTSGGPWLAGEPAVSVSEEEVVETLTALLRRPPEAAAAVGSVAPVCREFALTAAMKLMVRLPRQAAVLSALVAGQRGSPLLELQARSCEYARIAGAHAGLQPALLEPMPALDWSQYSRNLAADAKGMGAAVAASGATAAGAAAAAATTAAAAPAKPSATTSDLDLLDMLSVEPITAPLQQGGATGAAAALGGGGGGGLLMPVAAAAGAASLDSLLGGLAAPAAPLSAPANGAAFAATPSPNGAASLLDLLGGVSGGSSSSAMGAPAAFPSAAPPTAGLDWLGSGTGSGIGMPSRPPPASAAPAAAAAAISAFDDLLGPVSSFAPQMPPQAPLAGLSAAAAAAPSGAALPSITAYSKHGITITFAFRKGAQGSAAAAGGGGGATITATYSNANATPVTAFHLQAAVPKHVQLRMLPASTSSLAPGASGTQAMEVTNTLAGGTKPLAMRLRLSFALNGATHTDQADISHFPPGL